MLILKGQRTLKFFFLETSGSMQEENYKLLYFILMATGAEAFMYPFTNILMKLNVHILK